MLQQSSMNINLQSIINTISQNTAKKSHNVVQRGFTCLLTRATYDVVPQCVTVILHTSCGDLHRFDTATIQATVSCIVLDFTNTKQSDFVHARKFGNDKDQHNCQVNAQRLPPVV